MLEHPDITRVNLTGYPRMHTQPSRAERCPCCHEELMECSEAIQYGVRYFCDLICFATWALQEGLVQRTEVGG